jgi:signal transduction histidine kinase/ligand-binding sensor domain-containing protein/DNA-binding response OmpR family regulator
MPGKVIRIIFFLISVLLTGWGGYAQPDRYRFSKIDANDGLSHNQVKSFFKDSQGFLWIGTISGLNRFDGYNLRIFRNDPRSPTSIINDDINKMFEDPDGKMWISTWSGLDVYDPVTETFRYDPSEMINRLNLPDQNFSDIVKDGRENFWFVHQSEGIFQYNSRSGKTTSFRHKQGDTTTISSDFVSAIQPDPDGHLWVIHRDGTIDLLRTDTYTVTYRNLSLRDQYNGVSMEYRFIVDPDNHLWIYIADTNRGIFHLDPSTNVIRHFTKTSSPLKLSSDIVRGVVLDNNNLIWIATDHGGVNVIHKKKKSITYILNSPNDERSIVQNSINTIYRDNDGIIWAGTFKRGVSYYHENIIRFPLYRHNPSDLASLPFDDINAFAEDEKGNIWIGTNGGGLIYFNRSNHSFKQYIHNPSDPNSLSNNVIVSLFYDQNRRLWIGTYFGGLNIFDGNKFVRLRHNQRDPQSISDDSIWEIFEDTDNHIWIGTLTKGIDVLDENSKKIASYRIDTQPSIHASYVTAFLEDQQGNIWIGTGYGIEVFNKRTGSFKHYLSETNNPNSLSNNSILFLFQDSRGLIWIGTHGGLNLYDPAKNNFRVFTVDDGLPHNSVITLAEDANKNLWLSTPNGISNFAIKYIASDSIGGVFTNYDEFDGLQGKQFNENAMLKTWKGEMVFGGPNGFNIFHPTDISTNQKIPKIVITDLQVLNKSVKIGEEYNGRVVLDRSISLSKEITLKHHENVFSIEFAALSFYHPEKAIYRYKLEGFDREWTTTNASQRKVTYTNLDPGDYTFRVLASNNDGNWSDQGLDLQITVLPPFWRTRYALVGYVLLILAALFLTRKLIQQRERMKFVIEQERQETQRMHELDLMKMKFFTNVSHEFRTPLTLILTPVEKLLRVTGDPIQKKQFDLIYRNAKRLLNLVNQLLDFRKLEVQEIKFNPSEGDIIKFISETVFSFSDLSEKKDVRLNFSSTIERFETIFDQDKLEKIIFNLLSNAFKFTPEHGNIFVKVDMPASDLLELKVVDTGIGIPKDKLDYIFERFFQHDLPQSMVNQGSGIGLSITKEFVKAHGGTISVESEVGKGSVFTVTFPLKEIGQLHQEHHIENETEIRLVETESGNGQSKLPSLLLVEDNEDFRFYLKDNLRLHYNILEAKDGKEGWAKVLSGLPDLVVSDIMMPEMNGLDLCKKIKHDVRVSHTPVILLTARTAEEQKLEGFESGADDYITKPFNFEILQSRIRNLIHQRELYQKELRQKIDVRASNVEITSLDEILIKKALKIVEERISDADFSVEDLSHELGMSRVHLYKKLHALTGKSPLEFIRTIRLQHAAQLLEKSQLTVSEVAYKVGFNNPKYFAKYFKEEFSVLPSAYSAGKRKGTEN